MTKAEYNKLHEGAPVGICDCGHWSTMHGRGTRYATRPEIDTAEGYGYCLAKGCECPRFAWVGWVKEGEP